MSSPIISCPTSMMGYAQKVLDGEYDIPGLKFEKPPVILDIGANVGSFSIWADKRWPGAKIEAYEPNPSSLILLYKNVPKYVNVHHFAVSDHSGDELLRDGKTNCGEASLRDIGEQSEDGIMVHVVEAKELPPSDVLKIDTEGSEWPILSTYPHLEGVTAVMVEWHSADDRLKICDLLKRRGFTYYKDDIYSTARGLMKWTKGIEVPPPEGVPAKAVNLLIACPCYGGMTYATHNSSVINLILELLRCQVKHELHYLPNESLIPRARNRFGTMMLQGDKDNVPFTHLLFLDVDIGFNARDIISLIALDKDIVALPYSAKDFDWSKIVKAVQKGITDPEVLRHCAGRPIINAHELTRFQITEAVQFPQLGTGILLSKRKVFEKMAEDPARKYKLMTNERGNLKDDYAYEFFRSGINPTTRFFDSEDYRYCLDARDLGFETWLWPNCVTSHTGPCHYIMDIATQASLGLDVIADHVPEDKDENLREMQESKT